MSGQHGVRGYLLQSIITVLDSLSNQFIWESITIEPNDETEKVDIKWGLPDGKKKLVQVKSSQNKISFAAAKRWAAELKVDTNADEYELICIGRADDKLYETSDIDGIRIIFKPLDDDLLLSDCLVKLGLFYESKDRHQVSIVLKQILLYGLTFKLSVDSIYGRTISRNEFDAVLIDWLSAIEKHVVKNPYLRFTDFSTDQATDPNQKIITNFLKIIGWDSYVQNLSLEYFDEKMQAPDVAKVDYYLTFESKLKDETNDHIFINIKFDDQYPEQSRAEIREFINHTNRITDSFRNQRRIDPQAKNAIYNILFWLSMSNNEFDLDFVAKNQKIFLDSYLAGEQHYLLVDNLKANFILSSVITAKNYRNELPVKFLYPITEFNSGYNKIGKRGFELPPEYINTSLLPIIKEDVEKISVLLFSADPYSKEHLIKVVWFLIRLTSGLANEYVIYFSDYSDNNQQEIQDALKTFENNDLFRKVTVAKSLFVETKSIVDLNVPRNTAEIIEIQDGLSKREIGVNDVFKAQLPYGDILKPLLNTDKVNAADLKVFLAQKGIYQRNAEKRKLMDLMVRLVFSPSELDNFVQIINVKDRPISTTPYFLPSLSDANIAQIFREIQPNFEAVTDNLPAKLCDPVVFTPDPDDPQLFVYASSVEMKDPTKQIAVNTHWEVIRITYQKLDRGFILNNIETNSKYAKIIASRITRLVKEQLVEHGHISDETTEISFHNFISNRERVNFLLSYNDIRSSQIFISQDITGLKYIFDESQDIPDNYKDKTNKDLLILFRGKKLEGLRELSEENFKDIILLEQIKISYQFEYKGVKSYYTVIYDFSDALKNKPTFQGNFRSQPYLTKNWSVKRLRNIGSLEKILAKEVERLKIEKLKRFDKI